MAPVPPAVPWAGWEVDTISPTSPTFPRLEDILADPRVDLTTPTPQPASAGGDQGTLAGLQTTNYVGLTN
eukprot:2894345-Pyramimonas_sp.AAC.1